jgi:cell fate (sporulation/competence/biofilm development) regulator YmcA (YheA/YmcA/DUF963 family)
MKIEKITRLVSDNHYGHVSMTAILEENDIPIKAAIGLDSLVKEAIDEIHKKEQQTYRQRQGKQEAIDALEIAIRTAKAELDEIPF